MVPTQSAKQTSLGTGAWLANACSFARATKGDVTPAGEEFCEILRITNVKSED
jgi:hypothetical protein